MAEDAEFKEQITERIPHIKVDRNTEEEVELFYEFTDPIKLMPFRQAVFHTYPELKKLVDGLSRKEEKPVIEQFVENYLQVHQAEFDQIMAEQQSLLDERGQGALAELAKLMDYHWLNNANDYRAVPTILPVSPFGENVFFPSILALRDHWGLEDFLSIGVHEISHMILFDLLKNDYPDLYLVRHSSPAINTLKEALAPVVMNQSPLKDYINFSNYPNGYVGNPNLALIFVREAQEKPTQITQYLQDLYERMHQDKKKFPEIMKAMFDKMLPLEDEFDKKQDLWNKYGRFDGSGEICLADEEAEKEYCQPIKLPE